MEQIILDTNIIIELTRKNHKVHSVLADLNSRFLISSVTLAETLVGARNKNDFEFLENTLHEFHILHLNENISGIFLGLIKRYGLRHRTHIADMLIASTSIYHSIPLMTLNKKDFNFIKGLKLV